MTTLEEKFKRLKLDIEPVIENKLRRLKNANPNIKPTLKNTILDIHSKPSKSFNPQHTTVFDKHFKNGKPKSFKADSNINMLEDNKYKTFARSRPPDPFEKLFGFKHKDQPIGYLDGYYEFNMAGKDNLFYIKDKLLRENGTITDLEARLQAKAEFMDLMNLRKVKYEEMNDVIAEEDEEEQQRITDLEAEIESGDLQTQEAKDEAKTKIKVNRAIRRNEEKAEKRAEVETDIKEIVESNKFEMPKTTEGFNEIIETFNQLPARNKTQTRIKSLNAVFKLLESKTQDPVKMITGSMTDAKITKAIEHNKKVVDKILREEQAKEKYDLLHADEGEDDEEEEEEDVLGEAKAGDAEAKAEPTGNVWSNAQASLADLKEPAKELFEQLQAIPKAKDTKITKSVKTKMNKLVSLIKLVPTIGGAYKSNFTKNSNVARAKVVLSGLFEFYETGKIGNFEEIGLRSRTAKAGGASRSSPKKSPKGR